MRSVRAQWTMTRRLSVRYERKFSRSRVCRPAGVAGRVRAVLAGYLRQLERGQEFARPVEVGQIQIGGADAVGIVRVRPGRARQSEAGGKRGRLVVAALIFDLC